MSTKQYNIILTGELSNNISQQQAAEGIAKLFKLELSAAEATLHKAPVTVKKSVDEITAQKYLIAFKKQGLVCTMEEIGNHGDATDTTPEATASPTSAAVHAAPEASTSTAETPPENFKGLAYKIEGRPDYSYLTVELPADTMLKVEASAMATMDTNIQMKTKFKGGFGRFLTGESIFINEFTAQNVPGEIGIAPGTPGDLVHQHLEGQTIFLQNSAFVAATSEIAVESKWQGMIKGFFSGESLFLIRCSGQGDLWFNSYGAIIEIDVNDDYVVDTGNIVAFTEGLEYNITKVGGYKSLFFSGEGFVCRFTGQGKVWIQTRGAAAFAGWAHYFRPVKGKG